MQQKNSKLLPLHVAHTMCDQVVTKEIILFLSIPFEGLCNNYQEGGPLKPEGVHYIKLLPR